MIHFNRSHHSLSLYEPNCYFEGPELLLLQLSKARQCKDSISVSLSSLALEEEASWKGLHSHVVYDFSSFQNLH